MGGYRRPASLVDRFKQGSDRRPQAGLSKIPGRIRNRQEFSTPLQAPGQGLSLQVDGDDTPAGRPDRFGHILPSTVTVGFEAGALVPAETSCRDRKGDPAALPPCGPQSVSPTTPRSLLS